MARADLSAMLDRLPGDEPQIPASPPAADAEPTPAAPASAPARRSRRAAPTPSSSPSAPRAGYLSFERKEARLRADQYAQLTEQARRLNRAKGPGGERITENTLIRVAIDLLLERVEDLTGATEAELRKSVSL